MGSRAKGGDFSTVYLVFRLTCALVERLAIARERHGARDEQERPDRPEIRKDLGGLVALAS